MSSKLTKPRPLALIGFVRNVEALLQKGALNDKDGVFPSCLSCEHFDEKPEICQKYNARPPARVIAFGCEGYQDRDDIPF